MATSISHSELILSARDHADVVGVSAHADKLNLIITEFKTVTIYHISDRQTIHSFTLKGDLRFTVAAVYNYEQEQLTSIVDHLGKLRLCRWTVDQSDYNDWKRQPILQDIEWLIEVTGAEPLILKSDKTVCWLSQLDEGCRSVQLLPGNGITDSPEIPFIRAYTRGSICELVYSVSSKEELVTYLLMFNSKQVTGSSQLMFRDKRHQICRYVGSNVPSYIVVSCDGRVLRWRQDVADMETLYQIESSDSVVSIHMLDEDQLLISCNNDQNAAGVLLLCSIKYRSLRTLKKISQTLLPNTPLTVISSYIITHSNGKLESHTYNLSKLTLKALMGSGSAGVGNSKHPVNQIEDDELSAAQSKLESCDQMLDGPALSELVSGIEKTTLTALLQYYCEPSTKNWSRAAVINLINHLSLPAHLMTGVCQAAVRHADEDTLKYLATERADLPEPAMALLLSHYLKKSEEGEMSVDGEESAISDIRPMELSVINLILSKDITDIYASEAMQQLKFTHVVMLLNYLNRCLTDEISDAADCGDGNDDDGSCLLSKEQICRWCTVFLDAHYTQMTLSDHAELLVSLHKSISQQIELQSNLMKMGAFLSYKPPKLKPSTGPYCIQSVTIRF